MSNSLSDIWKLKRRGARDSDRHKELIKRAIRKNGKELITQYNIIKSDGTKKVKVPIKFLERYRFKYGNLTPKKGTGQGKDIQPGQSYKMRKGKGKPGEAGDEEGEREFNAEVSIDEFVDIMLEELNLPWMEPNASSEIEVENEIFNSIERKGINPNLDIRRTLIENLKRHAAQGDARVGEFHENDFRYRTWENEKEYHSNAAIYLMMDRSASMDKKKTDIAKTFYFWMVQFLKRRYKNIDIIFIAHDVNAFFCTEEEFFGVSASGGTKCSSAFKMAYEHMEDNHPPSEWNNYVFEFSDGDNWMDDNLLVLEYVEKMLPMVRAMGYGEIIPDDARSLSWFSEDRLLSKLLHDKIKRTRFVSMQLSSKDDVFDALKRFFNIDGSADKAKRE
jgi:sporulation protein YhbH